METQEDSLDLTYLKSAALGINESQASLSRQAVSAITRLTSAAAGYGSILEHEMLSNQPLVVTEKPINSSSSVKQQAGQSINDTAMSNIKSSGTRRSDTIHNGQDRELSPSGSVLGDTQLVSQSVYEGLLNGKDIDGSPMERPFVSVIETAEGGTTQMTLHEGDTGHVDLFSDADSTAGAANPDEDRGSQASDSGQSSPTSYEPFPESQRFNTSTPAIHKGHISNIASTATPSTLRNPFGSDNKTPGSVMALSQLFNATQATSSPSTHIPRLEPPSDMPSPNIPIQRPMRNTVPFSPSLLGTSMSRPDPVEPEANYISMQESQAEREKRLQKSSSNLVDPDDDPFQAGESAIERRIRQMKSKNEVRKEFESIKAPARVTTRNNPKLDVSSSPPLNPDHTTSRLKALQSALENNGEEERVFDTDRGEDSEVETEQEEVSMIQPLRSSQRTQSFPEEDKENVDSGPVQNSTLAVSTHSALSSVLDLDQSPSNNCQQPLGALQSSTGTTSVRFISNPRRGSRPPWVSQPERKGNSREDAIKYGTQGKERDNNFLSGRSTIFGSGMGPINLSKQIPSSPPLRDINNIINNQPDEEDDSPISQTSPTPLPKAINRNHSTPHKLNPDMPNLNKGSSTTSRVFETPSQSAPEGRNLSRKVPETSPTGKRQNRVASTSATNFPTEFGDGTDGIDEDDNLPNLPRFNDSAILKSLGSQELAALRPSRRVQAILSSPSGRQRRSMTAIASDESPRPAASEIPINEIRLLNADDRIFQSMMATVDSPIKRRRGNDGKRIQELLQDRQHNLANELNNNIPAYSPISPIGPIYSDTPRTLQRATKELHQPSEPRNVYANDIWDFQPSPQRPVQKSKPMVTAGLPILRKEVQKTEQQPTRNKRSVLDAVVIHLPSNSSLSTPLEPLSRTPSSPSLQAQTERSDSILELNKDTEKPNEEIVSANHIFAFFNGRPAGYYPAICVGTSDGVTKQQLLVHFDDSEAVEKIDIRGAKSLELRIGDIVKVNHPDVPKVPHYVTGFGKRLQSPTEDADLNTWDRQISDVYGNTTVRLKRKLTKVVPRGKIPRAITMPISKLYLDQNLWSRFGERPYSIDSLPKVLQVVPQAMEQSMHNRATQVEQTPVVEPGRAGIFSGMTFALSYTGNEKRGKDVESMLSDNGGIILKNGFDQLFESFSWELVLPTAKDEKLQTEGSLMLTQRAKETGFTCLITDQHSRRAKYMQALALNLPCLAGQWVYACIEKQEIVEWEPYLLAAGSSIFLDNAVKSRILRPYLPSESKFLDVIATRPKVFSDQYMLFVMGRKQVAQQRQAYAFLTCALGAEHVYPVQTFQAALDILSQATELHPEPSGWVKGRSKWDWIYVGEESAATTARIALSKLSSTVSKPPTRGRARSVKPLQGQDSDGGKRKGESFQNIKILDNEFLCQILILGRLFER
ncbi:BRCT domain-containing protein [Nannizzia gypsea CBS 118893]|uniref:BRCT domain-containing protein n=1 Tax=Arthroderma gypseum (strain ATCC MYA-4604 / CBS 118893) TaxID=535722 RepID=E4UUB5_ARTGP|nr:BRCT domain-containing protein [Nannizzia gypsea CBS 118893]EFR00882.1 BRCT domain-containing protein [Nannizzia gypsea CBS 118893]